MSWGCDRGENHFLIKVFFYKKGPRVKKGTKRDHFLEVFSQKSLKGTRALKRDQINYTDKVVIAVYLVSDYNHAQTYRC